MERCEEISLSLPVNMKYAAVLGATLAAMLDEEPSESYNIQLAVHELFTNIVEHGYGNAPRGQVSCHLILDSSQHCFTAVLQDTAPPFDPNQIDWENVMSHWETAVSPQGTRHTLKSAPEPGLLQVRGRGFFLIHQLMSSITCHVTSAGNAWTLSKDL
jgi:anti-sigma regulatory factor (Ser/Thr protein kinase)